MALDVGPRMLYDKAYLDGGCVGDPPIDTTADNTVATFATNYVIAAIGLAAAIAMAMNKECSRQYKIMTVNFFAWTALGYGLVGVLHQVFYEDELSEGHIWLTRLSYIFTLLGVLAAGLLANKFVAPKVCAKCMPKAELVMHIVLALATAAIIVLLIAMEPNLILTGAFTLAVLLYSTIGWAIAKSWVKVGGTALLILSMILQVVLAPYCGDAAYPDCFRECPLPAPAFNHNALFHVVFAVGLLVEAVAMYRKPEHTIPAPSALPAGPVEDKRKGTWW